MPVQKISHYNFRLSLAMMEEVREFYEQVVGLHIGPRPNFTSFGYWLYAGEVDILHLTQEKQGDERRTGQDLTFDHVALDCTDWPKHQQTLDKHGVKYAEDYVPQTGKHQVFFRDPAGNGVELLFVANQP